MWRVRSYVRGQPEARHPEYREVDGAFVSGWTNELTAELAEASARAPTEAHGWDFAELDEVREVIREKYLDYPDRLERVDRAVTVGVVLTLHTWPVGGDRDQVQRAICRLSNRCRRRAVFGVAAAAPRSV